MNAWLAKLFQRITGYFKSTGLDYRSACKPIAEERIKELETRMAGWEVEGFISRLTKRDNTNSERLVLEAISHLRGFSRDCDGLRERATRAEAERDALGDAMRKLVDKLTEIERHPAFGTVFALASMRGMGYSGPNWEPELTEARAALQSCASAQQDDPSPAEAERDALRAERDALRAALEGVAATVPSCDAQALLARLDIARSALQSCEGGSRPISASPASVS